MKSVSLLSLLTARGWLPAAPALTVRFESQSSPPFAMEELTRENIANVAKATTPATKASATSRPVPAPSSSGISRSFTWQDLRVDGPARQQAIMTKFRTAVPYFV